ncbi:alpha/beta hydrolase [Nocardia crassostreae]|uniref:alpha/beta hydrolase n=1 Tax=Nocardia crassostreae TaxID=53428 RepID=UPI0008300275|nr:alpha/beta fold hydrolase [Nocardia crassostreae]
MPYFDGPRGQLHFRRWPVEHPAAVIALLPGIGQHSGHYHRFARALGAAHIELWTLDTSGHGLSEGDPEHPGALPELSADAHAFLDLIPSTFPLFLMGHSLGAATAVHVLGDPAVALPSGLILCGTPEVVPRGGSPKSARAAARAPRRPAARLPLDSRAPATATPAPPRREPTLPESIPVLVVHGVDDRRAPIAPIREWAHRISADLREYPDAGHDLLHEPVNPQVTADITDWVLTCAAHT